MPAPLDRPAEFDTTLGADYIRSDADVFSVPALHGSRLLTALAFVKQLQFRLGNIVPGVNTPVLAKHSKNFSLQDSLSIGVDGMHRSFEPMNKQVEAWRLSQLSNEAAKLIIYRAFIEGALEVPKHLARVVHKHYFDPQHEDFAPRTM